LSANVFCSNADYSNVFDVIHFLVRTEHLTSLDLLDWRVLREGYVANDRQLKLSFLVNENNFNFAAGAQLAVPICQALGEFSSVSNSATSRPSPRRARSTLTLEARGSPHQMITVRTIALHSWTARPPLPLRDAAQGKER
jgi:hypothetical protein